MKLTEQDVLVVMLSLLNLSTRNINDNTTINRRIRNHFGCTADTVATVWNLLDDEKK
jgi:hypothetical protein